MIQSDEEQ